MKQKPADSSSKRSGATNQEKKHQRLSQALRANLRRRKSGAKTEVHNLHQEHACDHDT